VHANGGKRSVHLVIYTFEKRAMKLDVHMTGMWSEREKDLGLLSNIDKNSTFPAAPQRSALAFITFRLFGGLSALGGTTCWDRVIPSFDLVAHDRADEDDKDGDAESHGGVNVRQQ